MHFLPSPSPLPGLRFPAAATSIRNSRPSLAAAVLLSLLSMHVAIVLPAARADVVERVVAVVNDDALLLSELRQRAVPFLPQIMTAESRAEREARLSQLYEQLLERLIEERLIRQAASRMNVRVTTADIDRAIDSVRQNSGLSEDDFWEAVRGQGFTEAQYRSDVRGQLLQLKVLNQRVRGRVNITEQDVRREYDGRQQAGNRRLRYRLSDIFLPLPSGATATQVAALREEALALRAELNAENFARLSAQHGGMDLGWLSQGDLPEQIESAVAALAVGAISAPIQAPNGFHILYVHEREQGQEDADAYAEARPAIYQELMEQAMQRQQAIFLQDLRRQAVIHSRL